MSSQFETRTKTCSLITSFRRRSTIPGRPVLPSPPSGGAGRRSLIPRPLASRRGWPVRTPGRRRGRPEDVPVADVPQSPRPRIATLVEDIPRSECPPARRRGEVGLDESAPPGDRPRPRRGAARRDRAGRGSPPRLLTAHPGRLRRKRQTHLQRRPSHASTEGRGNGAGRSGERTPDAGTGTYGRLGRLYPT